MPVSLYCLTCLNENRYYFVMDAPFPDNYVYGNLGSSEREEFMAYFAAHCLASQPGTNFALQNSKGENDVVTQIEDGIN